MMMGMNFWLLLTYRPVSLFSLKMTLATSSGGKTLFVPSPYTFKLAMVAGGFRAGGEKVAKEIFDIIKGAKVRFNPPEHLTVNHTFIKIKREPKIKTPESPFISSIAFREFCYFQGDLVVAVDVTGLAQKDIERLSLIGTHINYFGKQGSFFQFTGMEQVSELPKGFMVAVPEELDQIDPKAYQVTQILDDLGETQAKDLFERINSYSSKSIDVNKHRLLKHYLLPYKLVRENNNYSYYVKDL